MSFDPAGIKNACCMDLFVLSRILNTLITPWTIRPKLPSFYAQRQAVAYLKALEPEIHMGQKSYQVIVGFGEKMDLKDSWDSWNFEIIEERIENFMSQICLNSFLFFCHKI